MIGLQVNSSYIALVVLGAIFVLLPLLVSLVTRKKLQPGNKTAIPAALYRLLGKQEVSPENIDLNHLFAERIVVGPGFTARFLASANIGIHAREIRFTSPDKDGNRKFKPLAGWLLSSMNRRQLLVHPGFRDVFNACNPDGIRLATPEEKDKFYALNDFEIEEPVYILENTGGRLLLILVLALFRLGDKELAVKAAEEGFDIYRKSSFEVVLLKVAAGWISRYEASKLADSQEKRCRLYFYAGYRHCFLEDKETPGWEELMACVNSAADTNCVESDLARFELKKAFPEIRFQGEDQYVAKQGLVDEGGGTWERSSS